MELVFLEPMPKVMHAFVNATFANTRLCSEICILVLDRALRTMKIYYFYIEHDSCIIEKEKIFYEINEEEKGQISLT